MKRDIPCTLCARLFKTNEALSDHLRDAHGAQGRKVEKVEDPACVECGEAAYLVNGKAIYPHRPDLYHKRFWLCECGAYCGCHGVTTRPLGFPAGAATRQARSAAHNAFDPLWRSGQMNRRQAYSWLADALGIDPEDCHIGMMTADRAWQVVNLCQAREMAA